MGGVTLLCKAGTAASTHGFSDSRYASSQYGGAMFVWGLDTSAISVSISDGTTFASCSAVSNYPVRTRDAPQRSLTRRVWVPSDMGAAVGGPVRVAGGADVRMRLLSGAKVRSCGRVRVRRE